MFKFRVSISSLKLHNAQPFFMNPGGYFRQKYVKPAFWLLICKQWDSLYWLASTTAGRAVSCETQVNLSLSSYRPTLDSRSGLHVWECPLLFLAIIPAIFPSVPQSLVHTGPLAVQPSAKWRRHHVGLDLLQKRSHGHLIFTLYSKPYQKTCTTYNLHWDLKQRDSCYTAESS